MLQRLFIYLIVCVGLLTSAVPDPPAAPEAVQEPRSDDVLDEGAEEPPEGYYAFVESPNATPPRVRGPPYRQTGAPCEGAAAGAAGRAHVSALNLCGDLNRGAIPRNPMGHSHNGDPYPFELIRNQTLRFLSRTLPVLRGDDALPRVRHLAAAPAAPAAPLHNRLEERSLEERSGTQGEGAPAAEPPPPPQRAATRESRKFCEGSGM